MDDFMSLMWKVIFQDINLANGNILYEGNNFADKWGLSIVSLWNLNNSCLLFEQKRSTEAGKSHKRIEFREISYDSSPHQNTTNVAYQKISQVHVILSTNRVS